MDMVWDTSYNSSCCIGDSPEEGYHRPEVAPGRTGAASGPGGPRGAPDIDLRKSRNSICLFGRRLGDL